jgi:amino acid adenylation domain-containing protein
MPALWRLRGELDVSALEQALASLIERHPTLRTSFRLHASEVLQLIHPPGPFALAVEELGDRDGEEVIGEWLEEERRTPFDLTSGVLLRARLLQVSAEEHVLLVNHHHIASDGWSRSVLVRDLTELYNAQRTGRPSELAPLRVQYQDYAAWQRQRLSGERLQKLNEYWIGELEGLEPLELPTDRARPVMPSHRGGNVSFEIAAELLQPFEVLCRSEGATLQMGLLAVVALLLHRTSRQEDLAIGVPIWGRNHPDLEALIGFFINTLPVRTRFEAGKSFRELLAQVRQRSIGAYEHQELPFEQMVEVLHVQRDTSRNPLVQVMLQLVELPEMSLEGLAGLEVESLPTRNESSKLDLSLYFRRSPDQGLSGSIAYATALFEAESIERLTTHLQTLLGSLLQAPDAPAASLNLMPDSERSLIQSWQHGPTLSVPDLCVHQLFEQQVERTPEAIALIFQDQQLTYDQLNRRANQMSWELLNRGINQGELVAIENDHGYIWIVAAMAILKAGGAFLTIEKSWPLARQEALRRDASPRFRIDNQGRVCEGSAAPIENLGGSNGADHRKRYNNPSLSTRNNQLAYVVYTSGSTGAPKGVMVEHHALAIRCQDLIRRWDLGHNRTVLCQGALSFDMTLRTSLLPLAAGATVAFASELERTDPRLLIGLMCKAQCDRVSMTPSQWQTILDAGFSPSMPIHAFASAEPLSRDQAKRLQSKNIPQLIHSYGPTEATIYCTALSVPTSPQTACLPIGTPLPHTSIKVLDDCGLACPIGIPGEIHIGGVGLARGYLNNPELTAEKFIPDPFSSDPSARLYKTGDLASWNPDGTLAFHGRLDQQIKLRGFRIEPGEIEANLLAHPAVAQAAVLRRTDDPDNPRLIAYWVPKAGTQVSGEELRSFLAERLPEYMVPAALVELEALPLTSNGKLDRRALPEPSFAGDLERRVEPTTELERQLHGIWAEVLGHGDFGITDNFFAVGGHSLAAARLITQIERLTQKQISLAAFFREPTIQSIALVSSLNTIDLATTSTQNQGIPRELCADSQVDQVHAEILASQSIRVEAVENVYALTTSQLSFLLQSRISKGHDRYLRRQFFLFESEEAMHSFVGASRRIINRHQVFRTLFIWDGVPTPVQVVLKEVEPVVAIQCLLRQEEDPEAFVMSHVPTKIDLRTVTPFQIYSASFPWLKKWYAVRVIHHIAYDAATMELVDRETAAIMNGDEGSLPAPLPLGSLIAIAGSKDLGGEAFFKRMLSGVRPTLLEEIKIKSLKRSDSAEMSIDLMNDAVGSLHSASLTLGVPRSSMVFLALYRYLARATCSEDITVGVVLYGRTQPQLDPSQLAGPCLNILPLRIDRNQTSLALLKVIGQRLAGLQLHEQMSSKHAKSAAGLSLTKPLFNTVVNYQKNREISDSKYPHLQNMLAERGAWSQGFTISRNYPILVTIDDSGRRGVRISVRCPVCLDPKMLASQLRTELVNTLDLLLENRDFL